MNRPTPPGEDREATNREATDRRETNRQETNRQAAVDRRTGETHVRLTLDLDGTGRVEVDTGLPFFDHMLAQVGRHGGLDLTVLSRGDLEVDAHHTVEDTALALGTAVDQALGDRAGLVRFGSARVPLDEALAEVTLDLSGRPFTVFRPGPLEGRRGEVLGGLPVDLVDHVFHSFAAQARANVHAEVVYGENLHHCVEALFKAFARALRQAVALDPRVAGVPSTKGTLGEGGGGGETAGG